jgi:serine/threonine protein kinase
MDATAAVHPTDQTLRSYGLGRLDDASSRSMTKHLESCSACRRRVAQMSSDSLLDRIGDAQERTDWPAAVVSSDDGVSGFDADSSSQVPPPAETLPPGLADHPDYEVIRELGQGGMGTVYLALNRLMGRHEVLKAVSSHLIKHRGALDRFWGEIRNAARLHHTNIVTAYSAMRHGESIIFAMEYVEGLDLAKLVKATGPLPVANACNYVHQAALGLQHAHELGMVHRDIKPSNLMLARQGSRAVIKVLDFGLAKVKSEGAVDGGLTHEGQMLGTPDYIAPEQIGDARRADIRADIYSLGCTLYHLLTGGPPFKATSLYEILQAHHSTDATPLNLARPEVPVELAALVAKMMAKEPERRFQAPNEVAQGLKPFFKPGGTGSGGPKVELSCPGLDGPVIEAGARASTAAPQSATNKPDRAPASKQAADLARGGSVWAGLIDLRETEPLADAPPVVAGMKPRRPPAPWPMVVALSVLGAAALGGAALYLTTTTDRSGSMARGPENKGPRVENNRSQVVGSKHETSHSTAAYSTSGSTLSDDQSHGSPGVRPKDETSHSVPADSTSRSTTRENETDHVTASSKNADGSGERAPLPVVEKPAPATPAQSVRLVAVDSPDQRLQKLGLERKGKICVLTQESDVQQKFNAARSLFEDYKSGVEKRDEIELAIATFQQLDKDVIGLDFLINDLNQQLGQRPPRPNSQDIAQFDGIKNQRDQLARQRNEAIARSRLLKSQLPSQKERNDLNVKIERGREFCRSALANLAKIIESTQAKYDDLKKNDQVRSDLQDLKLGPSAAYKNIVTQTALLERFFKSPAKATQRKTKTGTDKKSPAMRKR